jgi:hypothetical protein
MSSSSRSPFVFFSRQAREGAGFFKAEGFALESHFNRKEIFEGQLYNVLIYGFCDASTVSTSVIVQLLQDLVSFGSLQPAKSQNDHALELYLQCLVATLRLLSVHTSLSGSGTITSKFVEGMYARIAQQHMQYSQGKVSTSDLEGEDFNNEFLFGYVLDFLGALPSEGSLMRDLLDNMGTISSLSKWVVIPHFLN